MKSYTDLEQSRKLAEILPIESADMEYLTIKENGALVSSVPFVKDDSEVEDSAYSYTYDRIPCWSLAALLSFIKDKCDYFEFVYLKRTYDGRATPLEDVYRLSTDVYDVYKKEAIDACVEMILKLHEQKLL